MARTTTPCRTERVRRLTALRGPAAWVFAFVLLLGLGGALVPARAQGDDAACVECHKEYTALKKATSKAHLACSACHLAADVGTVPHRVLGRFAKGQVAVNSRSCLDCHEDEPYPKTRHASLGAGCTGCHDAHSPKHGKVRGEDTASLCENCHDTQAVKAPARHKPAAEGDCGDCHAMHAAPHPGLLAEPQTKTCLVCHAKVKKTPHAAAGASGGHPVGGEKPNVRDPAQPGQEFSCGSCHFPHHSKFARLMRFDLENPSGFCQKCHRI